MQFLSDILLSILKMYRNAPALLLIIVLSVICWELWIDLDAIEDRCNKRIENLEAQLHKCREEQIELIISLQNTISELKEYTKNNTENYKK